MDTHWKGTGNLFYSVGGEVKIFGGYATRLHLTANCAYHFNYAKMSFILFVKQSAGNCCIPVHENSLISSKLFELLCDHSNVELIIFQHLANMEAKI